MLRFPAKQLPTHPLSLTANVDVPSTGIRSRERTTGAAGMSVFFALIILLPTMIGTAWQHTYAYGLLLWAVWLAFRANCASSYRVPNLGQTAVFFAGICMCFYLCSIFYSPMRPLPKDFFQLAREAYRYLLFFCLACAWSGVSESQGRRWLEKASAIFLLLTCAGFVLQACWPVFQEIMFRYYYINNYSDSMMAYMVSRPSLTFGNPNNLAYAITVVGLAAIVTRQGKTWQMLGMGALTTLCVTWTWSRTGMAAWLAGCMVLVLLHRPRLIGYGVLLTTVIVCGTCFLAPEWAADRWDVFHERFFLNHNSLETRAELWSEILTGTRWRDNWLFGVGPDTQGIAIFDSAYVAYLYRYGVFGIAITMVWPLLLFWHGWRSRAAGRRALGNLVVAMVVSQSVASYAMSPDVEPRTCVLIQLLFATLCMRPDRTSEFRSRKLLPNMIDGART